MMVPVFYVSGLLSSDISQTTYEAAVSSGEDEILEVVQVNNNEKGQLDHVLLIQTVNNHSLFIGDTKAEVLAKTGAPTEIKYNNINAWYIETSTLMIMV